MLLLRMGAFADDLGIMGDEFDEDDEMEEMEEGEDDDGERVCTIAHACMHRHRLPGRLLTSCMI